MATKTKPQISLEDEWLENPDLESVLESREEAKDGAARYRGLNKQAKEMILELGITSPKRIGRFVVSCATSKPRAVSFETQEGVRVSIKTADSDNDD